MTSTAMVLIPINADELGTVTTVMRNAAFGAVYDRNEVSALRGLAFILDRRYQAALEESARVETVREDA